MISTMPPTWTIFALIVSHTYHSTHHADTVECLIPSRLMVSNGKYDNNDDVDGKSDYDEDRGGNGNGRLSDYIRLIPSRGWRSFGRVHGIL